MVDAFNMTVGRPLPASVAAFASVSSAELSLTDQPGERAVATATSSAVILDLGAATQVTQAAALFTSLLAGNIVVIEASNNANFNPVLWSASQGTDNILTAPVNYRHMFFPVDPPISARYWRFTFQAGHFVSWGRLALVNALQVEYNADYGDTSWGYEEAPEPEQLDSGVTVLEELTAAPYFEFGLSWTSEREMEEAWQEFGRLQWLRKPVLVVRRPDAYNYRHSGIFWGVLRLQPFVAAEFDMFEVKGKIRSMV